MGQIKNIKLHIVTDIKLITPVNLEAWIASFYCIMSEQTEKAYQKQAPIFQNKKRVVGKAVKSKDQRFVKNVGLGFKTPREAVEGHYIDKKCPFTGNVSMLQRCQFRGFGYCWPMSTTLKNCSIQRVKGSQVCSFQEVFRELVKSKLLFSVV